MKRAISIFLLSLFLIHQFGYIGLHWIGQKTVENHWLSKSEYSGQVVEVDININMPYWPNQEDYIPIDGSFELEGKSFRKISQRYADGVLHLRMVRDFETQRLNESVRDWLSALSDDSNTDQNTSTPQSLAKMFTKDYIPDDHLIDWANRSGLETESPATQYTFALKECILAVDSPPPMFS